MEPPPLILDLRNELAELERLYDEVAAYGTTHNVPPEVVDAMQVALGELVSNSIRHGCCDGHVHVIHVEIGIRDGEFRADIKDDGCPFDPLTRPPVNVDLELEDRPIGGLGIHLVKEMMDRFEYERRGTHNCVCVGKRL